MKTSENSIHAVLRFGLVIAVMLVMTIAQKLSAQEIKWESTRTFYKGIDVAFGVKVANLTSNIQELNGLTLISEGGNAGIIFGSPTTRVIVRPLGLYSAVSNIGRTINTYSMEVESNTYLLSGILKRPTIFDIYALGGINFQSNKFFGHYVKEDLRPSYKSKAGKEPFLGKTESLLISVGLGAEYRLLNDDDFLHIFLAGKYQMPLQLTDNSAAFEETSFSRNLDFTLGVRFGLMQLSSSK